MVRRPASLGSSIGTVVMAVACAGVPPSPEQIAAGEPPAVVLTEAQRQRVADLEQQALRQVELGRFELAADAAGDALVLDPRAARARAVAGFARFERSRARGEADLHVEQRADGETLLALRLAPDDPVVGRLRGMFLAGTGHLSAAAAVAESVLTQAPQGDSRTDLLALAARWRYELGEERLAMVHLHELVPLRPDDAVAWFRLGVCLLRRAAVAHDAAARLQARDDALAAERAFVRCVELVPGDLDAHDAAGMALVAAADLERQLGDDAAVVARLQAAAARFADAAARFPAAAEPCFRLGVVAEEQQRPEAALAAYALALQRDPDHLGALLNQAGLLLADPADPVAVGRAHELLRRALAVADRPGGLSSAERARITALLAAPASADRRP